MVARDYLLHIIYIYFISYFPSFTHNRERTGEIFTRVEFDREEKQAYALEVEARDGAASARPNANGRPNTGTVGSFLFLKRCLFWGQVVFSFQWIFGLLIFMFVWGWITAE